MEKEAFEYTVLFREGDERGFTYFYNELLPALRYYAFRIVNDKAVAEDIVEDSFVKIWKLRDGFNHPQVIKSWLYTTVRNAALNILKEEQCHQKKNNDIENEYYANIPSHEQLYIQSEVAANAAKFARKAISILPPECAKIFTYIYIHGLTARQTAELTGLSISTIKNQKARGLDILQSKLTLKGTFKNEKPRYSISKKATPYIDASLVMRLFRKLTVRQIAEQLKVEYKQIFYIIKYQKAKSNKHQKMLTFNTH